ncbi:sodium/calcium exchanger regulatory protein 1-like [Mytilus trossulus]|uniref:sodium/calcium exchanger regulatory protein 1-like n=1 Tax=Mytilus trossulus TaxID=6551 RepID=UPI003006EE16
MADLALGTWNMAESHNFDDYMKALGVGLVMRKMANMAKPTIEISVDGDTWTIKTITTIKTTEITFKLNEEFNETTADGRKVKSIARLDGNRLDIEQKGDCNSLISREFDGNTMTLKLVAYDGDKEVTCTRKYLKAES